MQKVWDFSYYIIESMECRRPATPWGLLPEDLEGQLCYIGYLRTGERAFLNAVFKTDPTRFQPIHTSVVDDYTEPENGARMDIVTAYRIYHLRRATFEEVGRFLAPVRHRTLTVPVRDSGLYGT